MLSILFEDEHYIAVHKPAGLLVHKTRIAKDENKAFALQMLRDQVGYKVYPVHRIDRPTSGILLFCKSPESTTLLQHQFQEKKVKKHYLAVVRGYTKNEHAIIDCPLKKDLDGDLQEAQTSYWSLGQVEIPLASTSRYLTSRYSLVKAFPHTGRMHQIRRHFAHERNYIIGDSTHGESRQNRFFRENFGVDNLLLHAWRLEFIHPLTGSEVKIEAPLPGYFQKIINLFNWERCVF